jgi:hypothetical protein
MGGFFLAESSSVSLVVVMGLELNGCHQELVSNTPQKCIPSGPKSVSTKLNLGYTIAMAMSQRKLLD